MYPLFDEDEQFNFTLNLDALMKTAPELGAHMILRGNEWSLGSDILPSSRIKVPNGCYICIDYDRAKQETHCQWYDENDIPLSEPYVIPYINEISLGPRFRC